MAIWNKNTQNYLGSNKTLYEAFVMTDKDGNVMNATGSASNISIAAGDVDGYSHINKFGYSGADINGTATVWDGNAADAEYPYQEASTITATGASSADDGKTIEIQGLNSSYVSTTETITVGGAATVSSFVRVFRARMVSSTNTVVISVIQSGHAVAKILAGNGQTLMAVYTIPAGKTGYLLKFQGSMDKSNVSVVFKLLSKPFSVSDGAFNIKGQWGTQGGNSVNYDYPVPLVFTEKTDIKVNVTNSATCGVGAIFDLILVDNA